MSKIVKIRTTKELEGRGMMYYSVLKHRFRKLHNSDLSGRHVITLITFLLPPNLKITCGENENKQI